MLTMLGYTAAYYSPGGVTAVDHHGLIAPELVRDVGCEGCEGCESTWENS